MVTGVSDLNTAFEYRPYICAAQPPPPSLIPSHQSLVTHSGQQKTSGECLLPLLKCRRDTESAPVWSNAAKCGRPGCRRCSASQGAGKRGKDGFPGYFFVCLTCSALDRWGKKTDISLSCPMSLSAKQDLPFVRQLSVIFLSANEFWKSENRREKVYTRCALGFMSVLYTLFMKIASLCLTSSSQEMVDH